MADDSDENEVLALIVISLGAAALSEEKVKKKTKRAKKRFWVKDWLQTRHQHGAYNGIINELRFHHEENY